jgi:hypothetical protein
LLLVSFGNVWDTWDTLSESGDPFALFSNKFSISLSLDLLWELSFFPLFLLFL